MPVSIGLRVGDFVRQRYVFIVPARIGSSTRNP